MSRPDPSLRLAPENTHSVTELRQHLLAGIVLRDAVDGTPARFDCSAQLAAVGGRAFQLGFESHGRSRHALRHAAKLARILDDARRRHEATNLDVSIHSALGSAESFGRSRGYALARDPRRYVPRRVSLTPLFNGALPLGRENIHELWLWPASAYPFPSTATLLRGRLRRDGKPLAWGRVMVSVPDDELDFGSAVRVAAAFCDERGEFVCALGAGAVSGAVLPASVRVRLWPWVPPTTASFDPSDPLASLPLDDARHETGTALESVRLPNGYSVAASLTVDVTLGEQNGGTGTDITVP